MSVDYNDLETDLLAQCLKLIDIVMNGDVEKSKIAARKTNDFIERFFGTEQIQAALEKPLE